VSADPATLGAAELLAAYRSGELSPVEVLTASRARIETYNPQINAVLTVVTDRADRAADESRRRWAQGTPRPLEGVPFGVKDVIDVEGLRTTAGSRIYAERIARRTATVVRRAEEAGAVLVAKEATTEFAIGGPHNPLFGPVRNPWDTSRWSGGSSAGSGAALAARLYPLSIGSDAGGSIRMPSAWCGLTGLKPTHGAVPRTGVVPLSPTTETVGPMSRNADDTTRLFDVIRGYDPDDPRSVRRPEPSNPRPLAGLRLGIPTTYFLDVCDDEVRAGYDGLLAELCGAGAQLRDVTIPSAEQAQAVGYHVLFTEAAAAHAEHAHRLDEYDPVTVRRINQGLLTPAVDYLRALQFRHQLQRELAEVFDQVDLLVLPATPSTAPDLDELTVNVNGERLPLYRAQSRSTMLGNLSGVPGLVLPTGVDAAGCPVAAQLVARPHDEDLALDVARQYQRRTDHHLRMPPLLTAGLRPRR
jgi:aspartyl-tRNA(Asn)/glutamyl-tRNA(Gln) amidotransferase subunit A